MIAPHLSARVPVLIDAVSATAIIAIVAAKASIRIASPKKTRIATLVS
jgi:hypothetical protein